MQSCARGSTRGMERASTPARPLPQRPYPRAMASYFSARASTSSIASLEALAHRPAAQVVQALGEEPGVHDVGRARDGVAELADDDLAADQEDAHDAAALTSAWTNAGLVPQQPPTNDAPASTSAGRWLANTSGFMV